VDTILLELPGGAGLVQNDEGLVRVTGDVSRGWGVFLQPEDPYAPECSSFGEQSSVVGGRLPPGAVSADVIDGRGTTIKAVVAGDLYMAALNEPDDGGHEPIVCCRDAGGNPVRRPLAEDYPSVRVTDATVLCPACGALDYEEYTLTEEWGARAVLHGESVPSRVVCCRVCGWELAEGLFFAFPGKTTGQTVDEERARADRVAEMRAVRVERERAIVHELRFPVFAVTGRPARHAGNGSTDGVPDHVRVAHYADERAISDHKAAPLITVATVRSDRQHGDDPCFLLRELIPWIAQTDKGSGLPASSRAETTLIGLIQQRECRARALAAMKSEFSITIDAVPCRFQSLTTIDGSWVASGNHGELTITICAHDLDPSEVALETLRDPVRSLLFL
jgi:hypothetical protein